MKHRFGATSWPEGDHTLKRSIVVFWCLFLLFSGLLLTKPPIETSAPSQIVQDLASFDATSNGDMPEGSNAYEEQCHGSFGCSLVLPASPLAIIALTRGNTIGLEEIYRGIGRSPGLRPPKPYFFA